MNNFHEKACAVTLNRVFGYKPSVSRELVACLGCASAVFELDRDGLESIFGPYSKTAGALNGKELELSCRELEKLEREGCGFVAFTEPEYPSLLKECPDPPAGLYFRTSSDISQVFDGTPQISVVGTRDISPYGREWCTRLVSALASAAPRPSITSGFALGTDITAHLAAMDNGLRTVAVLPTGITDVYPPSHRSIARKLAATPGCALITDFPPGTPVQKVNFLRRNRIIAGIGADTVVVESRIHGGAMMTARLAQEYGRNVFALPGRIDDPCSQGCNLLIREKIAEPVTDLRSLAGQLGLRGAENLRERDILHEAGVLYSSDPDCAGLLSVLRTIVGHRGITPDGICRACGLKYSDVARLTVRLRNDTLIMTDLMQRCSIVTKFD